METTTYVTVSSGLISLNFGWWAYLQRTAKRELIESSSRWLKGSYTQSAVSEWRDHLILTFDNTFGLEPFSKDFIVKSMKVTLATTLVVVFFVLLFAIYFSSIPASEIATEISKFFFGKKGDGKDLAVLLGIPGAFLYNLVPDFLSLCETRFVLTYLHRVSGAKRLIGYLIIDLILSTGIFLVWFVFVFVLTFSAYPSVSAPVPDILASSLMFGSVLGVISNYLSSGWIWFYGIAGPVSRFFNGLLRGKATAISLRYLNIDEKPFDYLALLTSIILAAFLLLVYMWAQFVHGTL